MKKCTLCVDKIYNQELPEKSRVPACVAACPTGARSFGDLNDPHSGVSELVRQRNGFDLMPEQDTKPVNKYLPPKAKISLKAGPAKKLSARVNNLGDAFLQWVDKTLSDNDATTEGGA